MPNKSLEDHLFNRVCPCLPWNSRLQIALGATEGLAYLHEGLEVQIIYRDFKASNVLFKEFKPKLSDFGLARKGPADGLSHVSTAFGDLQYHRLQHEMQIYLNYREAMRVADAERWNPHALPIQLQNLQELQLLIDTMIEDALSYIFSFFQLCPSPILEKFFIRLLRYLEHLLDINSMLDTCKKPPDVIFNNLKVIKVNNFRGSTYEIKLLKFLLQEAVLLQSLIIVAPPTDVKKGIEAEHASSSLQC